MSATVRVNTSDLDWLKRRGHGLEGPIPYGTDVKGVMYFTGPVEVPEVEHVKFAGASMIRFDLGPDGPRDHSRWAMYPDTYLVGETPRECYDCGEAASFTNGTGQYVCAACAADQSDGGEPIFRLDGTRVPLPAQA